MARYLLARFAQGLVTLLAVSVVVFVLSRLTGDPLTLIMDPMATKDDMARELARLGLDRSYVEQYAIFLAHALLGDFGQSVFYKRDAFGVFLEKLPATLELGGTAMLLSILIAIPIGVLSAVHQGGWLDRIAKIVALTGQSAPVFWIGLVMILLFSVTLGWLPTAGRGTFRHLVLPAITLGWYGNAFLMRITRSAMLDVLGTDYVRLARLEGLPERRVIWKHAFKNAATSIVTTLGLMSISLVTGAVVTETVFAWPGVGRLTVDAIFQRDFPVVQTAVILIAVMVVAVNLAVDVVYAWIDPRVRFQ
ncbi:MAG: ABC transporter permease [Alphaproteobacteria bacterium]|nr:ABC transporter permease [Alphaproteobacteria bacterium]